MAVQKLLGVVRLGRDEAALAKLQHGLLASASHARPLHRAQSRVCNDSGIYAAADCSAWSESMTAR
jgi:hypothetical protein